MARYEFEEGSSSKFWEIVQRGKDLAIRFGRIGSEGQSIVKKLASPAAAKKAYEKLVAEKIDKGYMPAAPTRKRPAKKVVAGKSLDVESLYLLTEKANPVPGAALRGASGSGTTRLR